MIRVRSHPAEVARAQYLLGRLQSAPPPKKQEHFLHTLAGLWSGVDFPGCLTGGKMRVTPSAVDVDIVALHAKSPDPKIQRAALSALRIARIKTSLVVQVVAAALQSTDNLARLGASYLACSLGFEAILEQPLLAALSDPVWSVRWNAASVLVSTQHQARAVAALGSACPTHRASLERWFYVVEKLSARAASPLLPLLESRLLSLAGEEEHYLPQALKRQIERWKGISP